MTFPPQMLECHQLWQFSCASKKSPFPNVGGEAGKQLTSLSCIWSHHRMQHGSALLLSRPAHITQWAENASVQRVNHGMRLFYHSS
jgi:hypothetical protein